MIIKKVDLAAVAARRAQYPEDNLPEIAFAGRSNVGKSSLINLLLNRRNFARTSSSPGKTQTINFYQINDAFRIVDLPGYGYAKVSKSVKGNWGDMVEEYLKSRNNLLKVIQLVDLRHPPSVQDIQMYEWLKFYKLDGVVVATKSDKLSKNEAAKNLSVIKKDLKLGPSDVIISVSALNKTGQDKVHDIMDGLLSYYSSRFELTEESVNEVNE